MWNSISLRPRYCHCRQVSYGEMIACENPEVSWITFLNIFIQPGAPSSSTLYPSLIARSMFSMFCPLYPSCSVRTSGSTSNVWASLKFLQVRGVVWTASGYADNRPSTSCLLSSFDYLECFVCERETFCC